MSGIFSMFNLFEKHWNLSIVLRVRFSFVEIIIWGVCAVDVCNALPTEHFDRDCARTPHAHRKALWWASDWEWVSNSYKLRLYALRHRNRWWISQYSHNMAFMRAYGSCRCFRCKHRQKHIDVIKLKLNSISISLSHFQFSMFWLSDGFHSWLTFLSLRSFQSSESAIALHDLFQVDQFIWIPHKASSKNRSSRKLIWRHHNNNKF